MIRRFALASAVLIAAASATPAMAGTATSNLNVTATVPVSCTISTSPLEFGAYDPIGANASTPKDINGSLSTTCTSGATATITLGQGANPDVSSTDANPVRRLTDGSSNYLSYVIFSNPQGGVIWANTSGTGVAVTGTGSSETTPIFGRITSGQNTPAGSYTDTIVATVTY